MMRRFFAQIQTIVLNYGKFERFPKENIRYAIDVGYIICNNICYDNARYNKNTRGEEVRYGKKRDNYKSGYFECGI